MKIEIWMYRSLITDFDLDTLEGKHKLVSYLNDSFDGRSVAVLTDNGVVIDETL